jgi:hypothetical protein
VAVEMRVSHIIRLKKKSQAIDGNSCCWVSDTSGRSSFNANGKHVQLAILVQVEDPLSEMLGTRNVSDFSSFSEFRILECT